MAEANTETTIEQENDDVNTSNISAVEVEARKLGWKPQDEYEGEPANWRSAETFMALKPFYERIESQSKQIKRYGEAFKQVAKDVANIRQVEFDRAIKQVKAERKAAFDDGDMDRYHTLEEDLDDLKDQQREAVRQAVTSDAYQDNVHPAQEILSTWKSRNTWYESDEDLRDWADARGVKLNAQGMEPEVVLKKLEKEVREKFPTKFSNPNRNRSSAVSEGDSNGSSVKADSLGMSEDEIKIMNTIVKSGAMTKEEYLKEFKKVQGK